MSCRGTLATFCTMLLWIGGCPKRQGPASIVYVPAPPPKASEAAPAPANQQVVVIEEQTPPPEPEETPPPQTPEPAAPRPRRHPARTATSTETSTPETPETPPAEVPALEPRQSSAYETELRQQVQKLQQDVRQRLARLDGARLSGNERKTLENARTFFEQSTRAVASGDLQRALNLARKAFLLTAALE
jgi:hypothetical protein